jgi:hypothetical protein
VVVGLSLLGAYFSDPYVFAFTTLGFAWLTAPIALLGLTVSLTPKAGPLGRRLSILGSLALAAAAIAKALATLRTFNWA